MTQQPFRIAADWVIAQPGELRSPNAYLTPGLVSLAGGRILEVRHALTADLSGADLYLEGFALLPGLVNPHTHLEFSDLRQPLPAGENFPQWIHSVIAARQQRGQQTQDTLRDALTLGMIESLEKGVVAICDIVTSPWSPAILSQCQLPPRPTSTILQARLDAAQLDAWRAHSVDVSFLPSLVACIEQLGLTKPRRVALRQWRDQQLKTARHDWPQRLVDLALSPHAPYSTPPHVLTENAQLAAAEQRLLVMHLAESLAEREWIDYDAGPMTEMLRRLDIDNYHPDLKTITNSCQEMAQAPRALLVHGNYLTPDELDYIASLKDRLSICYCPRTHLHFGHSPYPLDQILSRGIPLVFGTDSRSSNPDLNLWQEAATALRVHSRLPPWQALAAITQTAAQAIGLQQLVGSIAPGRLAALNILPTGGHTRLEPMLADWFREHSHPEPLY